jgi:hypothetical protein
MKKQVNIAHPKALNSITESKPNELAEMSGKELKSYF